MMQTHQTSSGVLVLTLTATRIDAACAVHFKDDFREAVAAHSGRVVMNLAGVTFMDSSGLGAMVAALKALGGRKLELCNLTAAVDKVFRLTRMDKVFVMHEDLDQALASGGSKGADAA
ncbi:STAS domain-containing protein [Litoreibacter janthinus]|uniref:Anti-sigma factor antagonist n=1 Tax=Litoreibacter janthinus TaxID=670154 RepID=A0A1I6G2Q7_9RHOB|nr:STAS domain-containing protein [Litoreibacter janthinus]SFR36469.1 anti-sigma B factor antagonist [Litoreibacter janthinus]